MVLGLGLGLGLSGGSAGVGYAEPSFLLSDLTFSTARTSTTPYIDSNGEWAKAGANVAINYRAWGSGDLVGPMAQEPRTNKVEYARPSADAVSDHFAVGSGSVSVVTDSGAPITDDFTNNTSVWEVAASGSDVTVEWAGTTGNTNSHTMQITYKVVTAAINQAATLSIEGVGGTLLNARVWDWVYTTNVTPADSTDNLRLVVPDGMTIRFFFADAQEETGQDTNYLPHFTFPIDTAGASASRSFEVASLTNFGTLGATGSIAASFVLWGGSSTEDGVALANSSSPTTNNLEYRIAGAGDDKLSAEKANSSILSQNYGNRARLPRRKNLSVAWDVESLYAYDQGAAPFAEQIGDKTLSGIDTFYLNNVTGSSLYSTVILSDLKVWDTKISKSQAASVTRNSSDVVVLIGPQSNAQRIMFKPNSANGLRGDGELALVKLLNRYMANVDVYSISDTSIAGASCLKANTQAEGASAGFYLYDEDISELGNIWGAKYNPHLATLNIPSTAKVYLLYDQWQFDLPGDDSDPANVPMTTWKVGTKAVFAHLKSRYTNLEIVVQAPTGRATSSAIICEAFRTAVLEIAAELSYVTVLSSSIDKKFDSGEGNAHYFDADYIDLAERFGRYILKQESVLDLGTTVGPTIGAAKFYGGYEKINVPITHDAGGTDFLPTTAIEGFGIDVGGSAATVSAAVRFSATQVDLTLSAAPSNGDALLLTYPAGNTQLYTDIDNTIRDNSPYTFPLQAVSDLTVVEGDIFVDSGNNIAYVEATDSVKTYSAGASVQAIATIDGSVASLSRDSASTEPEFATNHLLFDTDDRLNYDADFTADDTHFMMLALETPSSLPSFGGLLAFQNTSNSTDTKARLYLRSNGQLLWSQNEANSNVELVSDITTSRKMTIMLDFTSNSNCDVYIDGYATPTLSFDPRDNYEGATIVNIGLGADDTLGSGMGKLYALCHKTGAPTALEREIIFKQANDRYSLGL